MRLLLIGASVRAAATSVRRAGGQPVAFDLYHDTDLAAIAEATRLARDDYPERIWDRLRHLDPIPWIYTGAIENHPAVVARITRRFPLLGNDPRALELARDPRWLAATLRTNGLVMPATRDSPEGIPTDGSWLVKPVASGGGEGITPWLGENSRQTGPVTYQERVAGIALGATFVRAPSGTRLLGLTRQFTGRPGNRFAYRGSLGPWPVHAPCRREVIRLGQVIGDGAGLRGLFGIDLIEVRGRAWLIEVNPRYTAAVEILEVALGRSILAEHLQAFDLRLEPPSGPPPAGIVGKAILFARAAGEITTTIPVGTPRIADIPARGTTFEAGEPVLTVFGTGDSITACRHDLARRLRAWRTRIEAGA